MKSIIILLLISNIFYLKGQESFSNNVQQVFYISTLESSDLVMVQVKSKKSLYFFNKFKQFESFNYVTHRDSFELKYCNNSSKNARYYKFEDDSYVILRGAFALYKYIIPFMPDSIAILLKKTYPFTTDDFVFLISNPIKFKDYTIYNIGKSKFVLILMSINIFNEIHSCCPPIFMFKNEKYSKGLYVKVLIPI